jgi:hypothetical protein
VGAPDTIPGNSERHYQSDDGEPFAQAARVIAATLLATMSLLLSRHAVYACRYRKNGSYVFFVLLSVLPMLGAFFLLAPVLGM